MNSLNERFSGALHNSARAWRQALDRRIKYLGVSQASWLTIAVIAKAGAPLSQSELADRLAVEGATMVSKAEAEAFRQELLAHIAVDKLRTATELLEQIQSIVEAAK